MTPIDTIRVFSRAGSGPRHITVGLSNTSSGFVTVASLDLPNSEGPSAVMFPRTSARWVRLASTSSYSASTVSVEEFEVFRAVGS